MPQAVLTCSSERGATVPLGLDAVESPPLRERVFMADLQALGQSFTWDAAVRVLNELALGFSGPGGVELLDAALEGRWQVVRRRVMGAARAGGGQDVTSDMALRWRC